MKLFQNSITGHYEIFKYALDEPYRTHDGNNALYFIKFVVCYETVVFGFKRYKKEEHCLNSLFAGKRNAELIAEQIPVSKYSELPMFSADEMETMVSEFVLGHEYHQIGIIPVYSDVFQEYQKLYLKTHKPYDNVALKHNLTWSYMPNYQVLSQPFLFVGDEFEGRACYGLVCNGCIGLSETNNFEEMLENCLKILKKNAKLTPELITKQCSAKALPSKEDLHLNKLIKDEINRTKEYLNTLETMYRP